MEMIEVCYKPVMKQIGFHKYFVYTDAGGKKTALRAGPDSTVAQPHKEVAILQLERGVNPFAFLRCYTGEYNKDWGDFPPPSEARFSEMLLQAENLAAIWERLMDGMMLVNRANYQYHPTLQSSNTLMDHVLKEAELPALKHGGWGDYWAPGSGLPMWKPGRVEGIPISHTVPEELIQIFKIDIALAPRPEKTDL